MEMADRVVSSPHLKWWEAESPEKTSQFQISKLQRITRPQAQKPTCALFSQAPDFAIWYLRFGTSLKFGGLGVGVSLRAGSKSETRRAMVPPPGIEPGSQV
jgi:hypothetical protein